MPAAKIGIKEIRRMLTTGEITSREMMEIDREIRNQRKQEYEEKKIDTRESAQEAKDRQENIAKGKRFGLEAQVYDLAGAPLDWLNRQFETFGDDKFQFSDIATLLAGAYILSPAFRTQTNKTLGIKTEEEEKTKPDRAYSWEDDYSRDELESIWAQTRY